MEHWLRTILKEPPRWSAHGPRPISVLPPLEAHVDEASAKAETATRIVLLFSRCIRIVPRIGLVSKVTTNLRIWLR